MNPPLASICIPTYNRPEFLRRAVESCLLQTYRNFEVVITDNSTNDETAKAAGQWTDPRVRYFKNEGNIGTHGSCNRGISLSRGTYIKFLMDDDLLKPRCLELMVEAMEDNPTAGLAMAPMDLIDEHDKRFFPRYYGFRIMRYRFRYQAGDGLIDRRKIMRDFLTRDYPCTVPTGIMFRKSALPEEPFRPMTKVSPEDDFSGDLELCMRVAETSDFFYVDEVLASFRHVASSHTARLHKSGLNVMVFYYLTRQFLAERAVQEMFRDDWKKIERDSIFFCSCRALLNGIAGVRSFNPKLIFDTFKIILREDTLGNVLRLPLFIIKNIWLSVFPPEAPLARNDS